MYIGIDSIKRTSKGVEVPRDASKVGTVTPVLEESKELTVLPESY